MLLIIFSSVLGFDNKCQSLSPLPFLNKPLVRIPNKFKKKEIVFAVVIDIAEKSLLK